MNTARPISELPRVTGEVYTQHPTLTESCPTVEWHAVEACTIEVYEEGEESDSLLREAIARLEGKQ